MSSNHLTNPSVSTTYKPPVFVGLIIVAGALVIGAFWLFAENILQDQVDQNSRQSDPTDNPNKVETTLPTPTPNPVIESVSTPTPLPTLTEPQLQELIDTLQENFPDIPSEDLDELRNQGD